MQSPKKTNSLPADFLPRTRAHRRALGWDALDILLVTGDAYVDHPSIGVAAIARYLELHGRLHLLFDHLLPRPLDSKS